MLLKNESTQPTKNIVPNGNLQPVVEQSMRRENEGQPFARKSYLRLHKKEKKF